VRTIIEKKEVSHYMNEKEEQVMRILWGTDESLSAAEIARRINTEWAIKSIQNIIRKLQSKGLIEISEITKIGKTYGRLFRPTVSSDEYALIQFNRFYNKKSKIPFILSALIGNDDNDSELSKSMEEIIKNYKEE